MEQLADAVRNGDRAALPRAITLLESTRADHREQAQQLLLELTPDAGDAYRVGITGIPGVGKSTSIEALGMHLIELGHRVAVLAVDPSSTRTGGSILGDKTRMARLAMHPDAYIRPSPTSGTLGGVAKATRETAVLLEAAGFDVILIETVGVGQSEVTVANMVDTFVLLTLARGGDQLQGIKKGVDQGHRVAVLAVDPSSTRTGGSILGDKTRMARLSHDPKAFIRPSPSSGTLGGVAAKTRETMLLCEAAGFDVILVETVGVGQSETAVADLTDFFLVLMLPGAGDELQGIKKGILELADMIAVNKADAGEAEQRANAAASEYRAALHILTPASATWTPPVVTISGFHNLRLDALWAKIVDHREKLTATGEIQAKRRTQDVKWMWALVDERLHQRLVGSPEVRRRTAEAEAVRARPAISPARTATRSRDVSARPRARRRTSTVR